MSQRKNILQSLLVGFFILMGASPARAVMIDFVSNNITVEFGSSFNVDVVVSGLHENDPAQIVSAYDLYISYDPSIIDAAAVLFGSNLNGGDPAKSDQGYSNSATGELNIWELSHLGDLSLDAMQPDTFTLATISFDTVAEGTSSLEFIDHPFFGFQDIKGLDAVPLQVEIGAGSVLVGPAAVVPEPGSLWLLLPGLLLLFRKKISY